MSRKYNIIIFGATGFTGKYLVEEVVKFLKHADESETFTWAVSARSNSKLDEILQEASASTGEDLTNVDKVIADISNFESLKEMARQCDVVLNCVGPYLLYGEVVVKACIAEGTHHLDLSGEAQYLEKIQLDYNKHAEDKGAYIIAPCGFDSIPSDMGTTYLQQQFDGDLNSVDIYLAMNSGGKKTKLNYGTYHSAVTFVSRIWELVGHQKTLFPVPPKPKYKQSQKLLHFSEYAQGWCIPNTLPDERVVVRSQRYFYEIEKQRHVQVKNYIQQPNIFYAFLLIIGAVFLGLVAQFKLGVRLLKKYPEFFTLGFVSREGPTREEMENLKFTFTLVGKGWREKLSEATDQHTVPPNKTKLLKIKGSNPGYGATNIIFLHCALSIIKEKDKMPQKGGVYTPATAFAKTNLVNRLNNNGVTFTIVDE